MLSCDWIDAEYRCEMTQLRGGARIKAAHRLRGADALSEFVERGTAKFAIEIVSPATLTAVLKLADAGETHHTFDLSVEINSDGAQARPGLIAVSDCVVPVAQLSSAWQQHSESIAVRAGQWLARGQRSDLVSPQTGLMRFVPDDSVPRFQMTCQHIHPFYEIRMNKTDLEECQSNEGQPAAKTIMLSAYVAALADANHQIAFTGGEDDTKEGIGYQLHDQIKALDPSCPTPGEEGYDPLRAATVLIGSEMIVFESENGEL